MPITHFFRKLNIPNYRPLDDSSVGGDGIKVSIMKHIKKMICISLKHSMHVTCHCIWYFSVWIKSVNEVNILKRSDEMAFSNYRPPLRVTCVFQIVGTTCIYMTNFINNSNLLYEYPFGFQKRKCTRIALILLVDKITEALDHGECSIAIFWNIPNLLIRLIIIWQN